MAAQISAIKNLTEQLTNRYQQFFSLTPQDYLLEKQTRMPAFQQKLFISASVTSRKPVTLQVDAQNGQIEVVTGVLKNGPEHQLLIQNPQSNLTKIIFTNRIRYISAL
ncbi:hypothetical protein [Secundilactobacillus malefermentans]|nr:hypothetical protein [Secundilactobacillus malefermentans]QEA32453.1 hypothetical protein FGL90_09825 [Secundilactobacillus malefermentans]